MAADGPARDFLADENDDLAVVGGDFALVRGKDAVPQGIKVRVRMIQGEVWTDESVGIPYDQILGVKNPNPLVVREVVGSEISDTPDVTKVVGSQLQVDADRHGSIDYVVNTTYSQEPFEGSVPVEIPAIGGN